MARIVVYAYRNRTAEFATQQSAIFEDDLGHSHQISLAEWRERPLREQLVERVASLLGSQL